MPNDLPNINDLAVFLITCETKNFSQAGRQLHLSQPAISQTINNLEKHFGTKLFLRQRRSIYLTEIGQALSISQPKVPFHTGSERILGFRPPTRD